MNSLNSILLEGNLVRDPSTTSTSKGTTITSFTIAVDRFYRTAESEDYQKDVSFFDVETWSSLAERCADQLHKGRGVRVVGRLQQNRWTDAAGRPHSCVKIVAEHVEFRRPQRELEIENADSADAAE